MQNRISFGLPTYLTPKLVQLCKDVTIDTIFQAHWLQKVYGMVILKNQRVIGKMQKCPSVNID